MSTDGGDGSHQPDSSYLASHYRSGMAKQFTQVLVVVEKDIKTAMKDNSDRHPSSETLTSRAPKD